MRKHRKHRKPPDPPVIHEQIILRPPHETVVEWIKRCDPSKKTLENILPVLWFIRRTIFPEGHDEIIAEINAYCNMHNRCTIVDEVIASLEDQKREIKKK